MLGGIAPIFLFNFFKVTPSEAASLNKIPLIEDFVNSLSLPPIPLYLDENLTGIFVETASRNIDIDTEVQTKKDGSDPEESQKALNSSVTIDMLANRSSIGLTILTAMMDVILPKVTSKEYSITFLYGATTVFGGKLNTFAVNQNANDELIRISMNIARGTQKTAPVFGVPVVGKSSGVLPL